VSPLSSRFDELDGQMWLDNVFIPWERVFLVEASPEPIATWLLWHHLYGWLAKAEFTLGLALALADAMALKEHDQTVEYLVDLIADIQTARSCLAAAERDPSYTVGGNCFANYLHLLPGGIAIFKARQRISELLRIIPGSSLVVAPSDTDLATPELRAGLEESFGGGGWTALQRSALLQLAWDHVSSGLDGRESAFELHASGGMPAWRGRLRQRFPRYNELANAVLHAIGIPMPEVDVSNIPAAPLAPRRVNTVGAAAPSPKS
jgi:4-hydroxyphenylacetate 3-monooxygenase